MMRTLDQIRSFQSDDGRYERVADVERADGKFRIFYNKERNWYAVKKHGTIKGHWSKTDPEYVEHNFNIVDGEIKGAE